MIVVVAVVAALLIVGFIGTVILNAMRGSNTAPTTSQGTTQTNNTSAVPLQKLTLLNGGLTVQLPTGWTKKSESRLAKTIDDKQFLIQIQTTPTDYLADDGSYANDQETISTVETAAGNDAYIIKANGDVSLSACLPVADTACSFTYKGQPLFALLSVYEPGDTFVRQLDFTDARTTQVIGDFTEMVKHLNL